VSEPDRHNPRCPYCGVRLRTWNGLVCNAHSDLPNLDPQLRRPKIQAQPIGVQPFAKGL
jgi:hypothetical protein